MGIFHIYIYIYGKLLGNKYKVEYIVIYKYVGQIGYGVRYHIIASFLHYFCVHWDIIIGKMMI